jgi:uncharacterized protein YegL
MTVRPGSALAQRPLHFFVLADCSGSMAADGKMRALNNAMRETIPHLVEVADANPHAQVLVRVMAFSTGARWHVSTPTPIERFAWEDLTADGYTDLGAALMQLAGELRSPPMDERALPPAIVLVSDGMPTDDYRAALNALLDEPWGARSVRLAVGIGRDADREMLDGFVSSTELGAVTANNPEQLAHMIRWASVHASRAASAATALPRFGPTPLDPTEEINVTW